MICGRQHAMQCKRFGRKKPSRKKLMSSLFEGLSLAEDNESSL